MRWDNPSRVWSVALIPPPTLVHQVHSCSNPPPPVVPVISVLEPRRPSTSSSSSPLIRSFAAVVVGRQAPAMAGPSPRQPPPAANPGNFQQVLPQPTGGQYASFPVYGGPSGFQSSMPAGGQPVPGASVFRQPGNFMQRPPPPASFAPFQYQPGMQQSQMFGPLQGAQFF
jgi:hypothetical protein